jgi:uncharacterized LabA/DUF88 family protein
MAAFHQNHPMSLALFIDIENLIRVAATMGLPVDLGPVLKQLKEFGSVRVRRSYGDLEKNVQSSYERSRIREMLYKNLIQIEDVPFVTRSKNTADMRLTVEALSLAFQDPEINGFAILASDRDYVPLFVKLREMGRTVIGVGVDRENMHPTFIEACDLVVYYESLFEAAQTAQAALVPPDKEHLQQVYYALLIDAVSTLEREGRKPLGAAISSLMRQFRSDFDPRLVGCSTFKEVLNAAQQAGYVRVHAPSGPGDLTVELTGKPVEQAPLQPTTRVAASVDALVEECRRVISARLRVDLPGVALRTEIISALAETYHRITNGENETPGIPLRTLTDTTFNERFANRGVEQRVVFKIGLSLFYARAFICQITSEQFNPIITGLARPSSEWMHIFNLHLVKTLYYSNARQMLKPPVMSRFLYEDDEHEEEAERLIDEAGVM